MRINLSQYSVRRKLLQDFKTRPYTTQAEISVEYGLTRRSVVKYCKTSGFYKQRSRRFETLEGDQKAFIKFYEQAPCLWSECKNILGYPINLKKVKEKSKTMRVFSWGDNKVFGFNLKKMLSKMDDNYAYFLGMLVLKSYIAIDQWGDKVVFLQVPPTMGYILRFFLTLLCDSIDNDEFWQRNQNRNITKIIIEDDDLYDLIEKMRHEITVKGTPRIIPKECKAAFYRGIFDIGGQFVFYRRFGQYRKTYWIFLRLVGGRQIETIHLYCINREVAKIVTQTRVPPVEYNVKPGTDNFGYAKLTWRNHAVSKDVLERLYENADPQLYNSDFKADKDEFIKWKNLNSSGKNYRFQRRR